MRFSEVINPGKYPKGVMSIPDTEFESMINHWVHEMGKRCGYRKQTRMEHWQEAIDSIYTALENELQTVDTKTIQSHKKWEVMMLAAKTYFPEHIGLYHPTLVEQQRTRQLVENSRITRHLRNKGELLKFLKADKDLGVKTITDLAVSRLQCEVLATSAEILVNRYRGGVSGGPTSTLGKEVAASAASETRRRRTEVSASSRAAASAEGRASYNSGVVDLGRGWKNRLSTAVTASAAANSYASASARLADLEASANAGLDAGASVTANIDYVAEHSCKVKIEYLRRLLGPQFKTIEGRLAGSVFAGAAVSGCATASSSLKGFRHKDADKTDNSLDLDRRNSDGNEILNFASLEAGGEVEIAVRMKGNVGCTIGQALDIDLRGSLFAGAAADAEFSIAINEQEVGIEVGGKALAGFEVGSEQKFTLRHPSRNVSIFSVRFRERFSAGAGVEGALAASASLDQCVFDTAAGATVGVGSSLGTTTVVSPRGALLLGYDLLAVPTVLAMGRYMARHHNGFITRRMTTLCDFLNRQACKGEINQVYLDNMARINACLSVMDADAGRIYKMSCRTAGFQGFTEAAKEELASGLKGASRSKYYDYSTETLKTRPLVRVFGSEAEAGDADITLLGVGSGMKGESVSGNFIISQQQVRGDRLSGAVKADKQELNRVVRAYEQARTAGSGECVAYRVLRRDMLEGSAISYS